MHLSRRNSDVVKICKTGAVSTPTPWKSTAFVASLRRDFNTTYSWSRYRAPLDEVLHRCNYPQVIHTCAQLFRPLHPQPEWRNSGLLLPPVESIRPLA